MAEYIEFETTKQAIDRIRSVYHRARNFNAVSVIDNVFGEIKEIPAAAGRFPRSAAAGLCVGAVFAVLVTLVTLLLGLLLRQLRSLAAILPQMELTARSGLEAREGWLMELAQRTSPGVRAVLQRNVLELFSSGAALLDRIAAMALELAGSFLGK